MISQVIQYVMIFFMIVGGIDKVFFANKYGFGKKFEEGINAMGPIALAMVGLMCFAPVLNMILTPIVTPVYELIGADPGMLAGTILALDMGGFPLAQEMTTNPDIVVLSGLLLGSMLGCTIVFAIPVALNIIPKKDRDFLAQGIMFGLVSVPFGCFIGGILAGISINVLLINLSTVVIFALIIILGLIKAPDFSMKAFNVFSKIIMAILVITFISAAVEGLTGFVVIPGMNPIMDQLGIVGYVAITLSGAFPLIYFITKVFSKAFEKVGRRLGLNDISIAGLITVLANSIPMYNMVKDMNNKGKVMVLAFSVCAATPFGDHLAYVSANAPEYIFPVMVGKISGGIIAVIIVLLYYRRKDKLIKQ